jgi:hypothetical protein
MGIKKQAAMVTDSREWRKIVLEAKGPQRTAVPEEKNTKFYIY